MTKLSTKKTTSELVQRYRPLALKAVLAAALQMKVRKAHSSVPNA